MQPSMHTPAQSMLRRPAASAAVIACAAIATSDSPCSTKSLGGRLHIAFAPVVCRNLRCGFHHEQLAMQRIAVSRNIRRCQRLLCGNNGGTIHGLPTHRSLPRASDGRGIRRQARLNSLDNEIQPDPKLDEGPASGAKVAMFAVAIAVVLGALFYGLNNTSVNQAGTEPAARPRRRQPANPAAPPGMRDVTPKRQQPSLARRPAPRRRVRRLRRRPRRRPDNPAANSNGVE